MESDEYMSETNAIEGFEENLEKENVNQTDLETEINKLEPKHEKNLIDSQNFLDSNIKKDELETIFKDKPNNQFTESKPQSLFNRVSSFWK